MRRLKGEANVVRHDNSVCISLRLFAGKSLKNTTQLGEDSPITIIIIHITLANWCHCLTVHHGQQVLHQDT